MTTEELYKLFKEKKNVCTDTRKIVEGAIFFSLKGENFDGNTFADKALNQGCSYVVIDNPDYKKSERHILVDHVLRSLQDLARYHRLQLKIPVLAITGSNGKTTTKELIREVMSEKFKTLATAGNLNNHIGVPLTLLSIDEEHEFAIIEMGANHIGEIKLLTEICQPNYGLITNIGKAHLEGFGSFEGVIKGKTELYDFLRNENGTAFVNHDNALLQELSKNIKTIFYGSGPGSAVIGKLEETAPFIQVSWSDTRKDGNSPDQLLHTQITGDYNFENILSAICVGSYFDVAPNKIKQAIESYIPSINRSQVIQKGSNKIVLDAYNANPSSMESAIRNFDKLKDENKVLILGQMMELGKTSVFEHEQILNLVEEKGFKDVILVGEGFYNLEFKKKKYRLFRNTAAALEWLRKNPIKNSTILIKGSRANALEKLLEAF